MSIGLFGGGGGGSIVAGAIKFGIIDEYYLSKIATVQTGSFSLFSSIFGLSSLMFIRGENSRIQNTLLYASFALSMLASFLSGSRGVWIAAIKNTINWAQNGQANTSSGVRLEMWKASFEVIEESPIFGVGEDNYAKHQQKLIDQGKIDKSVGVFLHPHEGYITSLVEQGGVLGYWHLF